LKKILIIKHGSFGDVVLSLYPIFSIKHHFKKSNITVLTESKYKDIFKCIPFINNIKIDNRLGFFSIIQNIKLILWFKNQRFDWVFDLQTSRRTNVYFFVFSKLYKFYWSGIAKKSSHPHLNSNRTLLHTIDRHKQQLNVLGIKRFIEPDWSLFISKNKSFNIRKPYVIVVAGGSRHRLSKRWKIENFLEVISFFSELNLLTVLVGGSDESSIIEEADQKRLKILNLINKTTFLDLATLSQEANIILGNDTGPMHFLVASSRQKTKNIVLFGNASDPKLCAPRGKNVVILQKENINEITPDEIKNLIN